MNKTFLFITPLTPKRLLTPLRKLLFDEFLFGLKSQSYQNWNAILIGEEEKKDGQIIYKSIHAESKELKLIFAKEYILNLEKKPDYIIRIDDDDIINPFILEKVANMELDCFADSFHNFYDIVSSKIAQQKRNWLANTVIHKYEHAMAEIGEDKIPLLQCDHSKIWFDYYSDKKIIFSDKKNPVYLRILSPTTITTNLFKKNDTDSKSKLTNINGINNIDLDNYKKYLIGFGNWKSFHLKVFDAAEKRLHIIWEKLSGIKKEENKNPNFFLRFLNK